MGLDDNAVSHSWVTPCVQAGLAWAVVEITTADGVCLQKGAERDRDDRR